MKGSEYGRTERTAHRLANAGYVRLANQGEKTTVAEEKLCAVGSP